MKKITFCSALLLTTLFFSCSSTDDTDENTSDNLLNTPVAGTLYGSPFTLVSSRAVIVQDLIEIDLSALTTDCDGSSESFPIAVYVPNAVGTYTSNVTVTFEDTETTDFVNVSGGITVEIQSIGNTVVGRVKAASTSTDNEINGKFTATVCQ